MKEEGERRYSAPDITKQGGEEMKASGLRRASLPGQASGARFRDVAEEAMIRSKAAARERKAPTDEFGDFESEGSAAQVAVKKWERAKEKLGLHQ